MSSTHADADMLGRGHRDRPFPPHAAEDQSPGLSSILARNIQALSERRMREEAQATAQQRVAEAVTRFAGSMVFVYIHLAIAGFWIVANLGWVPGVQVWDPTFGILSMAASVEAIFLSTFVLISQYNVRGRGQASRSRSSDQPSGRARGDKARRDRLRDRGADGRAYRCRSGDRGDYEGRCAGGSARRLEAVKPREGD